MRSCVVLAMVAACGKANPQSEPVPSARPNPAAGAWTCEQQPFALTTPVAEASAAAWWTIGDKLSLVVISDSGNDGQYVVVDPDTGETTEQGKLPLGSGASDDLEGLSARDGKLYGLTSAGWMRVWRRDGAGFALIDGPYPIGPVDLPLKGGHRPPKTNGMVCPGEGMNCGRNFEGLCLAPAGAACTGFAASKADGHLYCLSEGEGGKLAVDRHRAIAISDPNKLADCTFDDAGALWVGENIFGLSQIYRVDGWAVPAQAAVVPIAAAGIGNAEVIAVRGDIIYRMSDTNSAPSMMAKFRCKPLAR